MDPSSPSSAASPSPPCLYLPIARPDASVPTYAVLQLLGFSPNPHAPPSAAAESSSGSISSCDESSSKKLTAIINPSPMKKPGSQPPSPASRRAAASRSAAPPVQTTEKETVVKTDAATFREVVHRLTGAAESFGRGGGDRNQLPAEIETAIKKIGGDGRNRRRDHVSLLQRRKSSQALHRLHLTTAASAAAAAPPVCRELASLVPSPVTPLSSDFDKLCRSSNSHSSAVATPPSTKSEEGRDGGFSFFQLRGGEPRDRPTLLRLFPECPRTD